LFDQNRTLRKHVRNNNGISKVTHRIGIIGLGRMGTAMAQRFAAQGASVQGWTRSGHAPAGVPCAADIEKLVAASDALVLSLYADAAVAEVLEKLLTLDLQGKQIIETSTVVPDVLKSRIARIGAQGATAVDAPISGGPELVLAGQCGVFIGGEEQAAVHATEVLETISDRIFHVGPLGAGLVMKTINNGMIQAYFNGLYDMLPLAQRAGLSLETALKIVAGGPAGTPFIGARLPKVLGEDDTVGFTISAARKDKDVFERVAASFGLPAVTFARFGEITDAAISTGLGEHDPAALVRKAYDDGAT
jgi:3-hydroxyisobutyrate dehydrogenase-like beta-hydroxyacid dehydrogenase